MATSPTSPKAVVFIQFPTFVLVWPLILVGFILAGLSSVYPDAVTDKTMGWIWLCTLVAVLLSIGLDFDATGISFIILGAVIVTLGLMLASTHYNIPILHYVGKFLGALDFRITRHGMIAVSSILSFVYLGMIVYCLLCQRWVVTPGKLERRVFGKRAEEYPISNVLTVNYRIDDFMDYVLGFGAGVLVIKTSATTTKEIGLVIGVIGVDTAIDAHETTPVSSGP